MPQCGLLDVNRFKWPHSVASEVHKLEVQFVGQCNNHALRHSNGIRTQCVYVEGSVQFHQQCVISNCFLCFCVLTMDCNGFISVNRTLSLEHTAMTKMSHLCEKIRMERHYHRLGLWQIQALNKVTNVPKFTTECEICGKN